MESTVKNIADWRRAQKHLWLSGEGDPHESPRDKRPSG